MEQGRSVIFSTLSIFGKGHFHHHPAFTGDDVCVCDVSILSLLPMPYHSAHQPATPAHATLAFLPTTTGWDSHFPSGTCPGEGLWRRPQNNSNLFSFFLSFFCLPPACHHATTTLTTPFTLSGASPREERKRGREGGFGSALGVPAGHVGHCLAIPVKTLPPSFYSPKLPFCSVRTALVCPITVAWDGRLSGSL